METQGQTSIQKLDRVLKFFATKDFTIEGMSEERAKNIINKKLVAENIEQIDSVEFQLILQKLFEDKFVFKKQPLDISITFEGKYFAETNGYQGKFERENSEKTRVKEYAKRMIWLTRILALGTSIAAWYYLTELYKFYHCNCH